jgi:hypothetical protein
MLALRSLEGGDELAFDDEDGEDEPSTRIASSALPSRSPPSQEHRLAWYAKPFIKLIMGLGRVVKPKPVLMDSLSACGRMRNSNATNGELYVTQAPLDQMLYRQQKRIGEGGDGEIHFDGVRPQSHCRRKIGRVAARNHLAVVASIGLADHLVF